MQIRKASSSDLESIRKVHIDAFGDEGATVSDLALALIHDESAQPLLVLVAEEDSEVAGNIIFSSVYIKGAKDVSQGHLVLVESVSDNSQINFISGQNSSDSVPLGQLCKAWR